VKSGPVVLARVIIMKGCGRLGLGVRCVMTTSLVRMTRSATLLRALLAAGTVCAAWTALSGAQQHPVREALTFHA